MFQFINLILTVIHDRFVCFPYSATKLMYGWKSFIVPQQNSQPKMFFLLLTVKHRSCWGNLGEAGKREAKFKKQIYKKMLQRILNFILVLAFDKFFSALHTINQFVSCFGKLYALNCDVW